MEKYSNKTFRAREVVIFSVGGCPCLKCRKTDRDNGGNYLLRQKYTGICVFSQNFLPFERLILF